MQFKPITAITVLLLVVASLLVAGCTTNPTSNTNQTPSATPSEATQHDAFLEKYITAYNTNRTQDTSVHVKAWDLEWINSTSAHLQIAVLVKQVNETVIGDETLTIFPTTQDATNYLNTINKTAYSLYSTEYPGGGPYQKATGHAPQIYKEYEYSEGSLLNISEYKLHEIKQTDNIVIVYTAKILA